jgi:hypothetical protein
MAVGRWRVVEALPGPGPSEEYRANDTESREFPVRLSLWPVLRVPRAEEVERFRQAMEAGNSLKTSAFPQVKEAGFLPEAEALWVAQELTSCPPLEQWGAEVRDDIDTAEAVRSVAESLSYVLTTANLRGQVHGGLSPSEVLWENRKQCQLLHLGLRAFLSAGGHEVLGHLAAGDFTAPEVTQGGPLTPAADVFGFGRLVEWMLRPRADAAWLQQWEGWLACATAEEPSHRFASVASAYVSLLPVLNTLPRQPPPKPKPPPPPPTEASIEELAHLLEQKLPGARREQSENGIRLQSAQGDWWVKERYGECHLEVQGLDCPLPLNRTLSSATRYVEKLTEVLLGWDRTAEHGAGEGWLAQVLAEAGFRPRTRKDDEEERARIVPRIFGEYRWEVSGQQWQGQGERATVEGNELTLFYEVHGWVGPHEMGTVAKSFLVLDWTRLPPDVSAAATVVKRLSALSGSLEDFPALHRCRHCGLHFSRPEFYFEYQSCDDCAQQYHGLIH